MRYVDDHRRQTHDRIVENASYGLRQKGAEGLSVVDLMKLAGLTHGGFYNHFESRAALVSKAIAYAMDQTTGRWKKLANGKADGERFEALIAEPEFDGSDLNFAGWAKKVTGVPTITVGSVGLTGEFIAAYGGESSRPASLDELIRRLDREEFDLVAVGRALLQDSQWLLKVRDGRTEELMAFERTAFAELS